MDISNCRCTTTDVTINPAMAFNCPKCQRTIDDRRRPACEFRGQTIPASLLLNPEQTAAIERRKSAETKEHREFMGGGGGWTSDGVNLID